jgi:hypothetical protein
MMDKISKNNAKTSLERYEYLRMTDFEGFGQSFFKSQESRFSKEIVSLNKTAEMSIPIADNTESIVQTV